MNRTTLPSREVASGSLNGLNCLRFASLALQLRRMEHGRDSPASGGRKVTLRTSIYPFLGTLSPLAPTPSRPQWLPPPRVAALCSVFTSGIYINWTTELLSTTASDQLALARPRTPTCVHRVLETVSLLPCPPPIRLATS
jgi:hypothetical protein